MVLYADSPARRTAQLVGDLLLVAWIWVWVEVALVVRDATLALATPGREIDAAATGLSGWLRDAGGRVADIPLVGDGVATPFEGAGGAAADLAAAGRSQVEAVGSLAFWLAIAVAGIPIAFALLAYVPQRVRFVRRASAARRFLDDSADLDLLALRAMSRLPLHVLAGVASDPVRAWREGDPDVVRRLARLEAAEAGLRLPERLA